MSAVVIAGNTSGSITLAAPDVARTTTLTLPATSGTVAVNGPAFSAYQSTGTSMTSGVATKLAFQTEEFDTANCFDSTTNYRFTPNVAGYYQVNFCYALIAATAGLQSIFLYKNGAGFKTTNQVLVNSAGIITGGSALIYMNGSTDYLEVYAQQGSGGTYNSFAGQPYTYFQASLVRGA